MEPGEYLTNVLSASEYKSIKYEYFEYQKTSASITRQDIQQVEATYRRDGALINCDRLRDGIWLFENDARPMTTTSTTRSRPIDTDIVRASLSIDFSLHVAGYYEPAKCAQSKPAITKTAFTTSNVAIPSSVCENAKRDSQTINVQAVQSNSAHNTDQNSPQTASVTYQSFEASDVPMLREEVHQMFISAVLGSITFFLCQDHGLVPLNPRTLILPSQFEYSKEGSARKTRGLDKKSRVASLDISLSSLGFLIVKTRLEPGLRLQNCQSYSNTPGFPSMNPASIALWLAPIGTPAWLCGFEADYDAASMEDDQVQRMSPVHHTVPPEKGWKSWKARCLRWLSTKGLNTAAIGDGGWVWVQTNNSDPMSPCTNDIDDIHPQRRVVIPWPALLCFSSRSNSVIGLHSSDNSAQDWKDPIVFAENWFMSSDDRTNIILNRQTERRAAGNLAKAKAETKGDASKATPLSASALRRSSAGAIYPTPPDAISGHIVGSMPSFDGSASIPSKPHHLDHEVLSVFGPDAGSSEADLWDSLNGKVPNSGVSFEDNYNDDAFENLNGDNFGDTDVTDADFSFFDQPGPQESEPDIPLLAADDKTTAPQHALLVNNIAARSPEPEVLQRGESRQVLGVVQPLESVISSDLPVNGKSHEIAASKHTNSQPTKSRVFKPEAPFDKESVFRILEQAHEAPGMGSQQKKADIFGKVYFEETLVLVNQKYLSDGRFYSTPRIDPQMISTTSGSTSRRIQRHSYHRALASVFTPRTQAMSPPALPLVVSQSIVSSSESDASSMSSEEVAESPSTTGYAFNFKPGVKRKLDGHDDLEDKVETYSPSVFDFEHSAVQFPDFGQMPVLEANYACWSLIPYLSSAEQEPFPSILTDLEYITTAQILAHQAVSNGLHFSGHSDIVDEPSNTVPLHRDLMHQVSTAASVCLQAVAPNTLYSFIDIPGIPAVNQTLRLPPRPLPNPPSLCINTTKSGNLFALRAPHLQVRRSLSPLSILPTAMPFWETLGLAPSAGSKEVHAVCIYPNIEGLVERASRFLEHMRSAYISRKFGSHERASSTEVVDSLLQYNLNTTDQAHRLNHLISLKGTIARLSDMLLSLPLDRKNIVIYFIYPCGNTTILVHVCCAFNHLCDLYRKGLSERRLKTRNELVLQLVPLDFVVSSTCFSTPDLSEYGRLAMEVYDRCVKISSSTCAPAILLERSLPKSIDFKLTAHPPASLLRENSCLHLAYAQSIDDRWITTAWTNNQGGQQMTAAYCLGRKNQPLLTPFSEIANEIWETTLDMTRSSKVHWRIFIVKVGTMDLHECETWKNLTSSEIQPYVNLTLVTVQTNPSLQILPDPPVLSPPASALTALSPVSTPLAAAPSSSYPSTFPTENESTPAHENLPTTPTDNMSEADIDSQLIDLTDQSWGAILSHRLNNSNSLLETRPALISGYLIKRGGMDSSDAPVVLEINIINSEVVGNPRTFHEGLLRELLGYYRGLATLARVRGIVDSVKDGRPWHIAAAEKAVEALYLLM